MSLITDNEPASREGSQPPAFNEDEEEEKYIVADEVKSEGVMKTKNPQKKGRRLDKVVPPPAPCGRGGGPSYVNAPNEAMDGYVNAPMDRSKTCPYDNAHAQATDDTGGTGIGWDEHVPAQLAVSRQDSYLEPVSPDMTEYDKIIVSLNRQSYPDEDEYMSMHSTTSGDYMSMGGVRNAMDGNGNDPVKHRNSEKYMRMDDNDVVEAVTDEGYLKLTTEREEDIDYAAEAKQYLTLKEPSWDDEVPLEDPQSPAFMLREIYGEDTHPAPPAACASVPGYVSMDGKEQENKKHSYVNEDVFVQQRTDRVEAYATSGKYMYM